MLSNSESSGTDEIPIKFVKHSLPTLAYYITVIINTSIVTGSVPTIWKEAVIVPLHKKGDLDDPCNYRPIALLNSLAKVLEKVVAKQLLHHLTTQNFISPSQHGFRPGLSTDTALLKITNQLFKNIDNKQISLLMLTDLSKAFDSVNPIILLRKARQLNIDSYWFESYMKDRKQAVRCDRRLSTFRYNTFGVPQGSVLGPLLFTIYINDLSATVNRGLVVQYADDTQIAMWDSLRNLRNLIAQSEQVLSTVKNYYLNNGLLMNTQKTQIIMIGSEEMLAKINFNPSFKVDEEYVDLSNKVTSLGVLFDKHLRFDHHISDLIKKATGTLLQVNKVKNSLSKDARKLMVESLVVSRLLYGIRVWGNTAQVHLQRVQRLQNFAARVVDGNWRKHEHITPLYINLEWLKIENKYKLEVVIMAYKTIKGLIPGRIFELDRRGEISGRETRQCKSLQTQQCRTAYGMRGVVAEMAHWWNSLPMEIREATSLFSFKKRAKGYLKSLQEGS